MMIKAISAVVVLLVGAFYGIYALERTACERQAVSFEDHKYDFFAGCMVKHKGRWIPLDNIRGFDDKG